MRYLAIDYGTKRVGLALCDPTETFVSPLCQLDAYPKNPLLLIDRLKKILLEYEIDAVVVGLPLNMDDSEGPQAQKTKQFVQSLQTQIALPVHTHDERLSSAAADEMMLIGEFTKKGQKKRRDMLAACDILQSFLDHKKA